MKKEDAKKKVALQKKLKANVAVLFDKEELPKIEKTIDQAIEELNKELAENRRQVEEIRIEILTTMSYEQRLALANSVRLSLGYAPLGEV
ncbi:MAG: hypothetical protein AAF934_03055 [Bacteroidota bacterium]